MDIFLRFLGAAQSVTGSRTLVGIDGARFLVDCGQVQEREHMDRNWAPFPAPAASLQAVFLTHAHLDHCGLLPRLVREGFGGPIYATPATTEIAGIVLEDSAHLQAEDAAFKRKRHAKEGRSSPRPYEPLFTPEDVHATRSLFHGVEYGKIIRLADGSEAILHEAGHVLGSAMVELRSGGARRRLLFTGDIGRTHHPILRDTESPGDIDTLVMESTYCDRSHPPSGSIEDTLTEAVQDTLRRGGNVIVPTFAVERAQEILFHLSRLRASGRIPTLPVFLDSPMAINVTQVFRRHAELYDDEMREMVRRGESPFDLPGLKLVRTTESSKAINNIRGTAVILAGTGMCTGGRIKHHLAHNLGREESTILFVGYQAPGTPGRRILEGARDVRLFGRFFPVRARVVRVGGFSGHADREELLGWLRRFPRPPRETFVVHGEAGAALEFASFLREKMGWTASAPAYGEERFLK